MMEKLWNYTVTYTCRFDGTAWFTWLNFQLQFMPVDGHFCCHTALHNGSWRHPVSFWIPGYLWLKAVCVWCLECLFRYEAVFSLFNIISRILYLYVHLHVLILVNILRMPGSLNIFFRCVIAWLVLKMVYVKLMVDVQGCRKELRCIVVYW